LPVTNGTRNTGSDVRVQEMLRQVRHVLGAANVDFSVMTQSFDRSKGYFDGTRQVYLPDVFPPFLSREVKQNHGVIACEGSMFKSKFANALTTMMIGSLGLASAENKLSLAYGGEAGHMDPLIQSMCERYVHDSLVITRNVESQDLLRRIGIPPSWVRILPGHLSPIRRSMLERRCAAPDGTKRPPF
jgi:DNA-binding Xre family transcriptional regulator